MASKRHWLRALDAAGALALVFVALLLVFGTSLYTSRSKAKSAQCGRDRVRLFIEIDNYYIDTGAVPATLEHLLSNVSGTASWDGPYVDATDLVDPWGRTWRYWIPPDGSAPYRLDPVDSAHRCVPAPYP